VVGSLSEYLASNFYWVAREYQYRNIKPRILIEELIEDGHADGPLDYRFWGFEGKPEIIQVDNRPHNINPFYDVDWNRLELRYREQAEVRDISRPANLSQMNAVARALAADFDFVRIDLYTTGNRIYVGELTFTPVGGYLKFIPDTWDAILGDKWLMSKHSV
jgi:hypothetical protein